MKILNAFTFILFINLVFATTGFSRSPAVEPVSGISIDQGPGFNGHNGFEFKNGIPAKDGQSAPFGYSILFLIALVSTPFLFHTILKGNVVPATPSPSETPNNTVSLDEFRKQKKSEYTSDGDHRKAS
ncbi:MAG: hypothetical protein ACPGJV_05170 [Bacteriovoracaceae bacterium]